MLAYAASRPRIAARGASPSSMLLIASVHVVAIALLMSARMELPLPRSNEPIKIDLITDPPPPKAEPVRQSPRQPAEPVPMPTARVPVDPIVDRPIIDVSPTPDFDRDIGPVLDSPRQTVRPVPDPVRIGPRLATPEGELKPPYPRSKLLGEEEAALPLRLTIDERGRVVAVEALGPVDPVFLEAARRHLLAHWRYSPASEDGRPVRSTVKITLRFQLDG